MRTVLRALCGLAALGCVILGASSVAAAGAAPIPSNSIKMDVIATGLNNPRGVALGPDGRLYVAEAGLGAGNAQAGAVIGVGSTGSITQIERPASSSPSQRRVVTRLASQGTSENGAIESVGADGIAVTGHDDHVRIYTIMAESDSAFGKQGTTSQLGRLLRISPRGRVKTLADVGDADYSWADQYKNAAFAPKGQFPDANPYGVLVSDRHVYVVDAASNTLDEVLPGGKVEILAYFSNTSASDAVPTCVTRGPDGALYIGTLALLDFIKGKQGAATVYRVDPRQTNPNDLNTVLSVAKVWATGFNTITGCAFDPHGNFYATEFLTGDVVRVPFAHPSTGRTVLATGPNSLPGGVAADEEGNVYVTTNTDSPKAGQGTVVRFRVGEGGV